MASCTYDLGFIDRVTGLPVDLTGATHTLTVSAHKTPAELQPGQLRATAVQAVRVSPPVTVTVTDAVAGLMRIQIDDLEVHGLQGGGTATLELSRASVVAYRPSFSVHETPTPISIAVPVEVT